jgi:ferredoxin
MSLIRIVGRPDAIEVNLTTSLLNALLRNQVPIQTLCGGRASCGRDLIRIHEGAHFLSPRREMETRRLGSLSEAGEPSGPDIRLACQTYTRGDIIIEVLHPRGLPEGA